MKKKIAKTYINVRIEKKVYDGSKKFRGVMRDNSVDGRFSYSDYVSLLETKTN